MKKNSPLSRRTAAANGGESLPYVASLRSQSRPRAARDVTAGGVWQPFSCVDAKRRQSNASRACSEGGPFQTGRVSRGPCCECINICNII